MTGTARQPSRRFKNTHRLRYAHTSSHYGTELAVPGMTGRTGLMEYCSNTLRVHAGKKLWLLRRRMHMLKTILMIGLFVVLTSLSSSQAFAGGKVL